MGPRIREDKRGGWAAPVEDAGLCNCSDFVRSE